MDFITPEKKDVLEYAKSVKDGIQKEGLIKPIPRDEVYTEDIQIELAKNAFKYADQVNGGIGSGQKFPSRQC